MDKMEIKGKWNEWKGSLSKPTQTLPMMILNMKKEKMNSSGAEQHKRQVRQRMILKNG